MHSHSARLDVAKDIAAATQEYDSVAGWIRFVPFEFVVRYFYFRSDADVRTPARFIRPVVGDDRVGFSILDMDLVRPIGVGLTETRRARHVGLHQCFIPFPDGGIDRIPLSEVAGIHNADQATERQSEDK